MIILGVETSCDETALALLETRENAGVFECRVIQSLVHSQAELHSAYGGVFPSLAKREHGRNIVPLLHKLFIESREALRADAEQRQGRLQRTFPSAHSHGKSTVGKSSTSAPVPAPLTDSQFKGMLDTFRAEVAPQNPDLYESFAGADFLMDVPPIDRIAVTEGPGLEPALWVGINFARMIGALWQVPIIPIDHMEGHILGSLLPSDAANGAWQKLHDAPLPAIALLISGGHTELVLVEAGKAIPCFTYSILGRTKDDAVGEAFDKAARLLGLPYPGGPHIAELSHQAWLEGIPSPIKLPRPMLASGDLDFSFAGLKTAVLYAVRDEAARATGGSGKRAIEGGAPRTAPSTTDHHLSETFKKGLAHEFEQAVADTLDGKLRRALEQTGARSIIIGGGVSANHALRERFKKTADEHAVPIFMPSNHVSGDNALMIAIAGGRHHADAKAPGLIRAHGTKRLDQGRKPV